MEKQQRLVETVGRVTGPDKGRHLTVEKLSAAPGRTFLKDEAPKLRSLVLAFALEETWFGYLLTF